MEFDFTDEQNTIRELARQILTAEATTERAKAFESSDESYDESVWRKISDAGLLGIPVPEEHGGMGYDFGALCVLLEEVGRQVAAVPVYQSLVLGALPIAEFGTEEQKSAWLPRIASGAAIVSAAVVDATSGDLLPPATTARADADGYVLDGAKRFVTLAADCSALLVPAAVGGETAWFFVDPGAPGMRLEADMTSTGMPAYEIRLDGVRVDGSARLGGADTDGAMVAAWLEERALVAAAALQVGVSSGALEMTAKYVREREQFGVPIGSFQAVQHRCADGYIDLEAMRWTMWRAAWRITAGMPALDDARIAKFWAADGGSRIASSAQHLHGGIGSDVDYPIHRYFLWSKSIELGLGSAVEQLTRLGAELARSVQEAS
jgi:alkylation response protein AidB-like acyl-CoA dehydrogenase